jgi:hypothetical protein
MTSLKLNGWQRLWVVFSCFLLVPAVFFTVTNLPTNKKVMDDLEVQLREKGDLDLYEILSVENLMNGKSVKETEEKLNKMPNMTKIILDENKIHRMYEEVRTRKVLGYFQITGTWLGIWFALVGTIYALGWSLNWIARGFRKQ